MIKSANPSLKMHQYHHHPHQHQRQHQQTPSSSSHHHHHVSRRRKKRPNNGIRTVEVHRGSKGYGFTISGQQPCILSSIVPGSPADRAGLRSGEYLISVNGYGVRRTPHDDVVALIGRSSGLLRLQIADSFYSDSSDEDEFGAAASSGCSVRSRSRPRHARPRSGPGHMQPSCRVAKVVRDLQSGAMFNGRANLLQTSASCSSLPVTPPSSGTSKGTSPGDNVLTPGNYMRWPTISPPPPPLPPPPLFRKTEYYSEKIVHRTVLGYLGSIDIPRHLQSTSMVSLVRKCVKRIKNEGRNPTMILLTIYVGNIKLSNARGRVIADFPADKVVYCNSFSVEDRQHFGILTKSVSDLPDVPVMYSCHVFRIQTQLLDHSIHAESSETFGFSCTRVEEGSVCQEFPSSCEGLLAAIQALYMSDTPRQALVEETRRRHQAPSPQPSNISISTAHSSNSDSGIGFKDDYCSLSERNVNSDFPIHYDEKALAVSSLERNLRNPCKLTVRAMKNSRWSEIPRPPRPFKRPSSLNGLDQDFDDGEYVELLVDDTQDPSPDSSVDGLMMYSGVGGGGGSGSGRRVGSSGGGAESVVSCPCVPSAYSTDSSSRRSRCSPAALAALARSPRRYTSSLSVGALAQSKSSSNNHHHHSNRHQQHHQNARYNNNNNHNDDDDNSSRLFSSKNSSAAPGVYSLGSGTMLHQKAAENSAAVLASCSNSSCGSSIANETATGVLDKFSPKVYNTGYDFIAGATSAGRRKCSMEQNSEAHCDYYGRAKDEGEGTARKGDAMHRGEEVLPSEESDNNPAGVERDEEQRALHRKEKTPNRPWGSMQEIRKNDLLHGSTESFDTKDSCSRSSPTSSTTAAATGASGSGSPGGIVSWALGFEKLLLDPKGLQTFAKYLRQEISHENIYFWAACERYADTEGVEDRKRLAKQIYERHLSSNATEPVNVDSRAVAQITPELLESAPANLFAAAQKQVFNLMKFDCYPRFLKSDVYKKCVDSGGNCDDGTPEDGELVLKNSPSLNKIKKAQSSAEEKSRRSILPWHRKIRSKSKDRGEQEYNNKKTPSRSETIYKSFSTMKRDNEPTTTEDETVSISSSRSSLASWDLALRQSFAKHSASSCEGQSHEKRDSQVSKCTGLCRVILPDGSTTVVPTTHSDSVRDVVTRLLEKRALRYSSYDVLMLATDEIINMKNPSSVLSSQEVQIAPARIIKVELPSKRVVEIVAHRGKTLKDILKPLLSKHGFKLDLVSVCSDNNTVPLDGLAANAPARLTIKSNIKDFFKIPEDVPRSQSTLDEITNKVFEELRVGKTSCQSEGGSCKSDDQKSEGSSILSGKFFSRDSHHMKKKSKSKNATSDKSHVNKGKDESSKSHPPLIAKWKNGVKLQIPNKSQDEFLDVLERAQRFRLDDQRAELNIETPTLSKNKENDKSSDKRKNRKSRPGSEYDVSKFYDTELDKLSSENFTDNTSEKSTNNDMPSIEKSNGHTNSVCYAQSTQVESPKFLKPPPLPPKPKSLSNSFRGTPLPPKPFQRVMIDKKI